MSAQTGAGGVADAQVLDQAGDMDAALEQVSAGRRVALQLLLVELVSSFQQGSGIDIG
jgi:hypothetical protein